MVDRGNRFYVDEHSEFSGVCFHFQVLIRPVSRNNSSVIRADVLLLPLRGHFCIKAEKLNFT